MPKYFVYTRKSTESEDKQVLSLESQQKELDSFVEREKLEVVEYIEGESKSAKQPGRPIFDKMIKRIEKGEADGIIAWHPDRLARNSVDGGKIIYLLDTGKLKELKFPTYRFENDSQGKFMLNLIFGQSKYYVDSLSENVRRGNKTKLEKGWLPGVAPMGYLNDVKNKTIVKDPERFRLIRKMWNMLLSGAYSVPEIHRIACDDWGFKTKKFKRTGGKEISRSMIYRLFENPFYYGLIRRNGDTYQGAHEPMVTLAEFERVQRLLGRDERPRYEKHDFAYTGMIRCAECGCQITASNHKNRFGSRYIYYHCTKRKKGAKCSQKYVRLEELERQILKILDDITISDQVKDWAIQYLREKNDSEIIDRQQIFKAQQRAYAACQKQLDELTRMRLRDQVNDSEYASMKKELLSELISLKEKLTDTEHRASRWFELSEKAFIFANDAKKRFETGSFNQKREIVQSLGLNFSLKDGKLHVQLEIPYLIISKKPKNRSWQATVDIIGTFFRKLDGDFHIPTWTSENESAITP